MMNFDNRIRRRREGQQFIAPEDEGKKQLFRHGVLHTNKSAIYALAVEQDHVLLRTPIGLLRQ